MTTSLFNLIPIETVTGLTADSRQVTKGSLFFAIAGNQSDGHQYVLQALEAGATAAIIQYGHRSEAELTHNQNFGPQIFRVANTREALSQTSSEFYGYPSNRMALVGVTGTNGKTTVTHLMQSVFVAAKRIAGVIGTIENRVTLPAEESQSGQEESFLIGVSGMTTPDPIELQRTLAEFIRFGASAAAMEVTSHALDQMRVAGMQFSAAIFTNLTQDHLDYHKDMDSYFNAKAKLFTDYPLRVRVINADDAYGKKLIALCEDKGLPVITFGKTRADFNYGELSIGVEGIRGKILFHGEALEIDVPFFGEFNAQNITSVVAVAVALGIELNVLKKAFSRGEGAILGVPGRMEKIANKRGLHVLVDYAHTPDALEKALHCLKSILPPGKALHCLFGCGGDRDKTKRPLMGGVAEKFAEFITITSDNPRTEEPGAILAEIQKGITRRMRVHMEPDRKAAIQFALSQMNPGDILLIAGKGHEDYQIVGKTKISFDDRQVAREFLNS